MDRQPSRRTRCVPNIIHSYSPILHSVILHILSFSHTTFCHSPHSVILRCFILSFSHASFCHSPILHSPLPHSVNLPYLILSISHTTFCHSPIPHSLVPQTQYSSSFWTVSRSKAWRLTPRRQSRKSVKSAEKEWLLTLTASCRFQFHIPHVSIPTIHIHPCSHSPIPPFQIIQSADQLSVSNDAIVGLLKGAAEVLSQLPHDKVTAGMRGLVQLHITPLLEVGRFTFCLSLTCSMLFLLDCTFEYTP